MDNVVTLGGRQPPSPPRQPRLRPIGCSMPGLITTGNLEERFLVDEASGDRWMPVTYISVESRALLLMNCADPTGAVAANDQ